MRRVPGAIVVVLLCGCLPVMPHHTRVEEGLYSSTVVSTGLSIDSRAGRERRTAIYSPSLDWEVALHARDSVRPEGAGLRLAANVGLGGFGGSAYVELPRLWLGTLDAGVGYLGHGGFLILHGPYVQFGRGHRDGPSWFLRNGATWTSLEDSASSRVTWVPMIGIAPGHRGSRFIFLAAVVGAPRRASTVCSHFDCVAEPGGVHHTRNYLYVGMTFGPTIIR